METVHQLQLNDSRSQDYLEKTDIEWKEKLDKAMQENKPDVVLLLLNIVTKESLRTSPKTPLTSPIENIGLFIHSVWKKVKVVEERTWKKQVWRVLSWAVKNGHENFIEELFTLNKFAMDSKSEWDKEVFITALHYKKKESAELKERLVKLSTKKTDSYYKGFFRELFKEPEKPAPNPTMQSPWLG
jgi:hypothetical protein